MKRKAFVSGPIQGMETKQSYRDVIRGICIRCGYEPVDPWQREKAICKGTEPDWWTRVPAADFIRRDLEDIEKCDVLIAYLPRLSAVIVVRLPYPKRTELQIVLLKYFAEKFGDKAMEYANGIPCLNALAQSAGRLLRSPEDKGIIVMTDGCAAGRFKQRIPKDWREDMRAHYSIQKSLEGIKSFTADNARGLQKRK